MWWRRKQQKLVEQKLDLILERLKTMPTLDDIITSFDTETNVISARLDKLMAELTAAGQAPTPTQLAQLQAISDRLKALGADPANPIPLPATPVSSITP